MWSCAFSRPFSGLKTPTYFEKFPVCNFLFTPPSGRGLGIPNFFVVLFFGGHFPQTSTRPKNTCSNLRSFSVYSLNFLWKLLWEITTIEWHKNLFVESKNEDVSVLWKLAIQSCYFGKLPLDPSLPENNVKVTMYDKNGEFTIFIFFHKNKRFLVNF